MANLIYPNQRREEDLPAFDPDFPPGNPHNLDVAERLGLSYNPEKGYYVDEDGCLIRDRFGHPL